MTLALHYTALSDRGLVRGNNEDSVYAGSRLLALADGMGGHAAGEIASQLVIAALAPLDEDEPGSDLLGKLGDKVREGNSAIAAYVESNPELEGMGTTLTAILFANGRMGLAHIGDSRGYLLRDGELSQITKDDTFVQTLVDEGRITAEEAHSHPQRSLIMRALTGHDVEPALSIREAQLGDRYLLCSDGLSDPVSSETIREALQIPDIQDCALRLIELALRSGGPDNVTVVVADIIDQECAHAETEPILAGAAVPGDDDRLAAPDTAAGRASAINRRTADATKRVLPQIATLTRPTRSRRRMVVAALLLTLLVTAGLLIGGRLLIYTNYYVAADGGTVAIMRGVQTSILGIRLHEPVKLGCLDAEGEVQQIDPGESADDHDCRLLKLDDLNPAKHRQVQDGLRAGKRTEAVQQLASLKADLLPVCLPQSKTRPGPAGKPAEPHARTPGVPVPPEVTDQQPGVDCRSTA